MQILTLIRGISGSGKSTLANSLSEKTGSIHVEADQFFILNGEYKFDRSKLSEAHEKCYSDTESY